MAKVRKRTWTNAQGETRSAWIADYFDQQKRRHVKTFPTKSAAQHWLDETKIEIKRGVHTPANRSVTVKEAGEAWISQREVDGLERSTLTQYRQHLEHHIAALIGGVKLADLTIVSVRDFQNLLLKGSIEAGISRRSPALTRKIVVSLGSLLANAMADGRVNRNVVRDAERRRGGDGKRHKLRLEVGTDIPTKSEITAMLAAASPQWRPLIVTAVFTGMRASELRGLRWADVNLDRGEITVSQRADRWGNIGSPKSATSRRTIPLAPMVIASLKEWRLACPKSALDLVFPTATGAVRTLSSLHEYCLGPLQKAAGIVGTGAGPKYGMHALRHFAASLFAEQGFSLKRVQVLMGHSTIAITADVYTHLFAQPDEDRAAMAQLQARLVG